MSAQPPREASRREPSRREPSRREPSRREPSRAKPAPTADRSVPQPPSPGILDFAGTDWDDLRLFLAVARGGSLSAAARALELHHTTVYRRLLGLEARAGMPLVERLSSGYGLTQVGETLFAHAARIEEELYAAARSLAGRDQNPAGKLKVTTNHTLVPLLLPTLSTLLASCPQLQLELDVTSQTRDLERREADLAVRPSEGPPESVVGRRICKVAWAVYRARGAEPSGALASGALASGALASGAEPRGVKPSRKRGTARPRDKSLEPLGYTADMSHLSAFASYAKRYPGGDQRLLVGDVRAMQAAIEAGFGFGPLPCYVGDRAPQLERHAALGSALLECRTELWILIHGDLRTSARIRAFIDHVAPALTAERALFEGSE